MEEKKYDSELIGWVDDPVFTDDGQIISWTIKLKDHELKDILDNYISTRDKADKTATATANAEGEDVLPF